MVRGVTVPGRKAAGLGEKPAATIPPCAAMMQAQAEPGGTTEAAEAAVIAGAAAEPLEAATVDIDLLQPA